MIAVDGFFRGPRIDDPRVLAKAGIKFTLDLETSQRLIGDHSPLEEAVKADPFGVRVYSHPFGGILPPTIQELKDAVAFIKSKFPGTVYVHCEHGNDRTGLVCGAWRVLVNGWTPLAAAREALKLGLHWYVYWFWLIQLWRLK